MRAETAAHAVENAREDEDEVTHEEVAFIEELLDEIMNQVLAEVATEEFQLELLEESDNLSNCSDGTDDCGSGRSSWGLRRGPSRFIQNAFECTF